MSPSWTIRIVVFAVAILSAWRAGALAQEQADPSRPPAGSGGADSIQAIMADYNRQLLDLERHRLDRMARLAVRQPAREAAETYETLFRLAIANNLFADADPVADRVLKSETPVPFIVRFLAETINLIAAADRGQYDESLADLRRLAGDACRQPADAPSTSLDTPSLLIICNAYYQRLVQGKRYDMARKAFELLQSEARNPDVKEFCKHRLRQLNLIGKPAPAIQGHDVDGKPVDLVRMKGNVVLVVFWATWLPNASELDGIDSVYEANRERGFRVVGIDLDTLQDGGTRRESVLPHVRRFLLDHNVRWPTLINGEGAEDYAAAYGVTEIPASVLIGRDGNVVGLDLSRTNLDQEIADALKR